MVKIDYADGFYAETIPEDIVKFITGKSYQENKYVKLCDLAYLHVKYIDFNNEVQSGELIVNKKLANEVLEIFHQLYEVRYEIEKIRLVDNYDADDERSMGDNNSSAFNFRMVADTDCLSLHSFGRAIDINPLINPYIVGEKVMPANAVQYSDRELAFAHKIDHEDVCYRIFIRHGWKWGGDWKDSKDYQHFYKDEKQLVKAVLNKIKHTIKG